MHVALALLLLVVNARANPVLEWNAAFLDCVRKEMPPPCLVARNLAILHLVMHVAVGDAIKAHLSEREIEAAARVAGDEICRALFPTHTGEFARLSTAANFSAQSAATLVGRKAAQSIMDSRKNDGSTTVIAYVPSEQPGQWRRTEPRVRPPELPNWGRVKPFLMASGAQFRPPPPPALASEEYAKEVNEVKVLGAATGSSRSEEQTLIALLVGFQLHGVAAGALEFHRVEPGAEEELIRERNRAPFSAAQCGDGRCGYRGVGREV